MPFDIVLPSVVSIVTIITIWLYPKVESKIKSLFEEEQEFRVRDAIFLVIAMGGMITAVVFIPQQAIQILFLAAYSFLLFLFTYIAVEKWYLSVLPPIVFVVLYLSGFWDIILLNVFAIIFVVCISVYLSGLFSWKTVLVFAVLITVMDVVQVIGTGFMGEAAGKFVELRLPVFIQVPLFPIQHEKFDAILLGLGDIFLTGLLAIQTMQKYDRKAGIISAIAIGFAFFVFEITLFYSEFATFFPATLVVVLGWLLGLGIYRLVNWLRGS
jgi:hypothetical protein